MKRIYIAGAYSDDNVLSVLKNIGRGQYYAGLLFKEGFAPFCPWLDKEFVISLWQENLSLNQFYEYSNEWLKVSDAVFVVPNHNGLKNWQDSHGTKIEIYIAGGLKIPVFFDLDLLKKWSDGDN